MAVGGTLMGVVITHLFQRGASRRAELFARAEALRQERIATYTAFASALEDYRHGQAGRWYHKVRDPDGEAFVAARDEAHRLRAATRQALYRVKLLTGDRDVVLAAERAYGCTRDVSTAEDQETRDALDSRARDAIETFVTRAAALVR